MEKTKKSYYYFLKTIDSIRSIKSCIKDVILEKYAKGEKSFMWGKHPSKETREKMRMAKIGKKNSFFGKQHTKETRKKI